MYIHVLISLRDREIRECHAFKCRNAVQSIACQSAGVSRDQMHDLFSDDPDNLRAERRKKCRRGIGAEQSNPGMNIYYFIYYLHYI